MKHPFRFPFPSKKGARSEKNTPLLQIIVVISSSILSSSAIATAVKAWLDNKKTTLTIQIDGGRKILTYEGQHLKQDAPTIHIIMEKLSENTNVVPSVDTVIPFLREKEQKQQDALEAGNHDQ